MFLVAPAISTLPLFLRDKFSAQMYMARRNWGAASVCLPPILSSSTCPTIRCAPYNLSHPSLAPYTPPYLHLLHSPPPPALPMSSQLSVVLLSRLLALKESAPFSVVLDSLAQSAHYLLAEFAHRTSGPVIFLGFETPVSPAYASAFLNCSDVQLDAIAKFVAETLALFPRSPSRPLVVVDSLNYVDAADVAGFVSAIVLLQASVVAVYHKNAPQPQSAGYPGAMALLSYIAQAIFDVAPAKVADTEELSNAVGCLALPPQLNLPVFKLTLTNRRKSGKALVYHYTVDTVTHEYSVFKPEEDDVVEDEELLKDLTTFNLTTSSKQRLAREQVELPFMEAQTELGKYSGAIVYEFEKDDDYDEEDPYEDPF